ncbi:phosphoribosylformylglycinamidine synthase, PurS protein [Campylobacter sputorum subsp. bubulus]|uniref:Phosphoribosylformylglycinamidine synthase subunit PurS n=1 Tax=Campylobacter sputorum subsp. sputorum TaxID=32024 RepID=A0A381DLJ6_9BACT|nr:phosphoribosylformylglycinamidine synthase subunit PurS [Campylobacter sputorum]ASM34897.1 phosphoribosylformylglycinamidine synthase PurLQS, PurS subunit [Campylobacter sputorum aubsp. sputorum RM3237]ASM36560.1 phosphoribosylformylglycinamidine synthase PurLQS, PurS subunit [Campylobacter sputorum bv. faecalis CCUG 20703]ASM38258.1 phosphoribosylformylglycinamidine synthase PurLQS, PurS subunit [Campylobacter sputorum bv. paraureolyticus LMG 11764]KAB0581971.1 phosphoribosylformylglycinami
MKVVVNVRLKSGVLDPQGKAVEHALASLGFDSINSVRIGKQIVLDVKEADENDIKKDIEKMCEELLANTVIEDYEIVL